MKNISAYIETVSVHYWGEPTRRARNTLRWGTHGSREVDLRKGTWFDFENNIGGGVVDLVRQEEGATLSSIPDVLEKKFGIAKSTQKSIQPSHFISKAYNYVDASGELQYQVLRYEPKTFRQRKPDGNGGWQWKMDGVEPVPYNLNGLTARADKAVYVVEGEKCADKLIEMGAVATTSHGGAGKWRPELNKYFRNRHVVILPDNDEAGQRHADIVAANLVDIAAEVRRIDLPGLLEKQDVVDWFNAGNTIDDLRDIVKEASVVRETEPADQIEVQDTPEVFTTYTLDYLRNMPPVEWLVDGLLTQHGLTVAYGQPGAGKSFLALDIAMSVAYGRPWQEQPVKQGAVLYIAGEGVGGLGKRVKAWQSYHKVECDAPLFVLPVAVKFSASEDIEKLLATIDSLKQKFSLVIVDTVARSLLGEDENSSQAAGLWIAACNAIQSHAGAAVLGVHHSGKDATRGMRGSSAILGGVDAAIRVLPGDDSITVQVEKQKDAEPAEDMRLDMLPIALMGETSLVLQKSDSSELGTDVTRVKLTTEQQLALDALYVALAKEQSDRCHIETWHLEHRVKTPNHTAGKRRDARAALQSKRVIFIDEQSVIINKALS